jgi:hypothetical protein
MSRGLEIMLPQAQAPLAASMEVISTRELNSGGFRL